MSRVNNNYNNNRRKTVYNNARYNHTSEAYNYAHDYAYPEYDFDYTPRPRRKKQVVRRAKRQPKVVYAKAIKEKPQYLGKIIFTMVVLLGFTVSLLASNASNIATRTELSKLNNELKTISEENTHLQTELTKNLDLAEVEKLATAKLGMQVPASYQTVYINVPKEGYTVQYEDTTDTQSSFSISSIKNFVFKD